MSLSAMRTWEKALELLQAGTALSLETPASSAEPPGMYTVVVDLLDKLQELPSLPKANWKKLVQQLQVPLHVGEAFSTAAQHSYKSPSTYAALHMLTVLLSKAAASGLIDREKCAAVGSLAISMRQQLQQAGVLQHLTTVMAALAADLRSEAAALAEQSEDQLCSDWRRFSASRGAGCVPQVALKLVSELQPNLRALWGSLDQTEEANSSAWLRDCSEFVEATMQLSFVGLKHIGSVVRHVLPAVQRREPQQAAGLYDNQRSVITSAMNVEVASDLAVAVPYTQLHLSPHCLPYLALWLVVYASWLSNGCTPQAASNSSGRGDGINSSSEANGVEMPTLLQLHMLMHLGLAPQLTVMTSAITKGRDLLLRQLQTIFAACSGCYNATADLCSTASEQQPVQRQVQVDEEQQRLGFEQLLKLQLTWLLLPSALLPCAHKLLLLSAASTSVDLLQQQMEEECVAGLLEQSGKALITYSRLQRRLKEDLSHDNANEYVQDVLGVVLQLADQLLLQQQQPPQCRLQGQTASAAAAAAAAALGGSQASSSMQAAPATSANSSGALQSSSNRAQKSCPAELLALLSTLVHENRRWFLCGSTATASDSIGRAGGDAEASVASPSSSSFVPPVAERFVEVCTALEAGLRAVTRAVQLGAVELPPTLIRFCLLGFLVEDRDRFPLALHMNLRGPAASVLELRQFYSMLSTVLKLGRCRSGVSQELCWGQQVADYCCWAAAQAAVGLLQADSSTAAAAAAAAAAEADRQQLEVEYLPSLAIFGRCCLVWAEQLEQQVPELNILASAGGVQQDEQGGAQGEHSAAHVCIPGWQKGAAAAAPVPCRLQQLIATASSWVGDITPPGAYIALEAAAGGSSDGVRQQLEALAAAQQAGQQEGVSEASLTALVQQLQATVLMLTSVAVPHFCNNPACVNINGPTDVWLVSGRSCVCAGCRTARYCGRDCQQLAWPQHQQVCKAMAAAAAAAADAQG